MWLSLLNTYSLYTIKVAARTATRGHGFSVMKSKTCMAVGLFDCCVTEIRGEDGSVRELFRNQGPDVDKILSHLTATSHPAPEYFVCGLQKTSPKSVQLHERMPPHTEAAAVDEVPIPPELQQ